MDWIFFYSDFCPGKMWINEANRVTSTRAPNVGVTESTALQDLPSQEPKVSGNPRRGHPL